MGHNIVGTQHLRLGLLIEGGGLAAHGLEDLGATVERVRPEIERLLGSTRTEEQGLEPLNHKVGNRVLVHDPQPPYRLWEGRVEAAERDLYEISGPGQAGSELVKAEIMPIHPCPMHVT